MTQDIGAYEGAKCTLYRVPPIDYQVVTKVIEETLAEAWKDGRSASGAIESILRKENIVSPLAEQIAPNIAFQRKTAIGEVIQTKDATVAEYSKMKDEALQNIKNQYLPQIQAAEQRLEQAVDSFSQATHTYTAAQQSLEEMRQRVKANLEKIGGQEGLESLLKINQAMEPAKIQEPEEIEKVKEQLPLLDKEVPVPKIEGYGQRETKQIGEIFKDAIERFTRFWKR